MTGFSWIEVANIEMDTARGEVTITLKRNWMYSEAKLSDLPEDFRKALQSWCCPKDSEST